MNFPLPSPSPPVIRIAECTPGTRQHFGRIWATWLKAASGRDPEPEDVKAITEPEAFYIARGGMVYLVSLDDEVVGCVAVKKLSDDIYEVCKLVVTEQARGFGAGRCLMEACMNFVQARQGKQVVLQTWRLSTIAIEMYRRMGFTEVTPPPVMSVLQRTEIIMGVDL